MRKFFTMATLLLGLCVAGCQKGGYTVSGTIADAQDGDTVLLLAYNSGDFDTLQTTVIKDGHFIMTGRQDSTVSAVINYVPADREKMQYAHFFLENACIDITMSSNEELAEVKGTLVNEQWTTLNQEALRMNKAFEEELSKMDTTEAAQALLGEKVEQFQNKMLDLYRQFVRDNITNYAGQFVLSNYASILGDDFVMQQLQAMGDDVIVSELNPLKEALQAKEGTAVGKPMVDIKAQTPDGKELAVSEVAKGAKVVMIDFWASWCGPCRQEMPNVKAAYERFHDKGFEIVGVSLDDNADNWKQAITSLGMTWPQISDLKGWECEGAQAYAVRAIPATVLVKDGVIVARDLRGDEIAAKLEELLK